MFRPNFLKIWPAVLALTLCTGTMFAAGINLNGGTAAVALGTITCNLTNFTGATLTGAAKTVTVTLAASPTAATTIGISAITPAATALVVGPTVAGAVGTTLASAAAAGASLYSSGVVFSVNAQAFCANAPAVGSNTLSFNFTGGSFTSATVSVIVNVIGGALTQTVLPSSTVALGCNTANGPGSAGLTAAMQTINLQLNGAPPVGNSVAIAAGTYTVNGGGTVVANLSPLVVTVPATALTSANWNTGINATINAQPYCANALALGSSAPTFSLTGTVTPSTGAMTGVTVTTQPITVNLTVIAGPSVLTASPSAISINCTWDGSVGQSHYTPGQPQFVSVTGPAIPATVFSVNPSTATSTALAWATLNPDKAVITGITAGTSPYNFTVAASAGCGAFGAYGQQRGTVHLTNGMNLDKVINVTLNIVHGTPLTATLSASSLPYVKGSGVPGYLDVAIGDFTGSIPYFFTVDTTSLPPWLTVDSSSGTTPRSIRFSSTSIVDTMAPGAYSKVIRVQATNYGDLLVNIPMQVSNPPSTLSVSGTQTAGCTVTNSTQSCNWVIGQPLPTLYITLKSSDAPIPYSITTGGTLAPIVAPALLGGLAYNFGSAIPVTFNQTVFSSVAPGTMVSGTVNIASGTPATTYVVTFNITAQAPGAILTGISPTIVPTLSAGQRVQVVLLGSGFVQSTDPTQATTVGIVGTNGAGSAFAPDTNINVNVLNASNILLTITVPTTADTRMDFATATTFTVTIGVCNPAGGTCATPTGTYFFTIGAKPIIQTVTSASAYVQSAGYPPVAPYDIISIFGTNLCSTCVGSNAVMYGSPQIPNLGYPTSLSNTDISGVTRTLQVAFQTHAATPGTSPVTLAGATIIGSPVYAPLLFATNNQINLLVPQAVTPALTGANNHYVDILVNFGIVGGVVTSSNAYTLTAVASDPGIFTVGSDGQGSGAILDKNYAVVSQTNPAAMHASATSDPVMIYMTGLGTPASLADNTFAAVDNSGNGLVWSNDCIASAGSTGYTNSLGSLTGVTPATADGLILQSALLNTGRLVPCMDSSAQAPTVTIGSIAVPAVTYAGWVADSIAGLYQVNVTLPSTTGVYKTSTTDCVTFTNSITNITQPVALPICVTSSDGKVSQAGVTVWLAPRLVVAAPLAATGSPLTLTEKVGTAASPTNHAVIATEGSGSGYTYAITSGVLPSGLSLSSGGTVAGTPALGTAGSYPVTVTATDMSTPVAITGSVSFNVNVGAGLFLASSVLTSGTSISTATVWTGGLTASGGSGSYNYVVLTGSLPAGLTLQSNGTVTGSPTTSSTATVVFKATDANDASLTGTVSVTFSIT